MVASVLLAMPCRLILHPGLQEQRLLNHVNQLLMVVCRRCGLEQRTCLCLNIISEHLAIQVQKVISHGFIGPLMDDRSNWVKPPAGPAWMTSGQMMVESRHRQLVLAVMLSRFDNKGLQYALSEDRTQNNCPEDASCECDM